MKNDLTEIILELENEKSKLKSNKIIQFEDFFYQEYKHKSNEVLKEIRKSFMSYRKIAFCIHILVDLNVVVLERQGLSRKKISELLTREQINNNSGIGNYFQPFIHNTLKNNSDKFYKDNYQNIKNKLKTIFNID